MSNNGFNGPEAVIIRNDDFLWIVRAWMIEKGNEIIEIRDIEEWNQ
jgi:hypothetical protein